MRVHVTYLYVITGVGWGWSQERVNEGSQTRQEKELSKDVVSAAPPSVPTHGELWSVKCSTELVPREERYPVSVSHWPWAPLM